MKFLKRLARLREDNARATTKNQAISKEADKDLQVALQMREHVTEQARRLGDSDVRNHYSESLTHAFRGNPA